MQWCWGGQSGTGDASTAAGIIERMLHAGPPFASLYKAMDSSSRTAPAQAGDKHITLELQRLNSSFSVKCPKATLLGGTEHELCNLLQHGLQRYPNLTRIGWHGPLNAAAAAALTSAVQHLGLKLESFDLLFTEMETPQHLADVALALGRYAVSHDTDTHSANTAHSAKPSGPGQGPQQQQQCPSQLKQRQLERCTSTACSPVQSFP